MFFEVFFHSFFYGKKWKLYGELKKNPPMKYILFWESLACSLRQAFSVKMYDIKISEDFFNFSDYNYREDGGKLHFGVFFFEWNTFYDSLYHENDNSVCCRYTQYIFKNMFMV